MKSEPDLQITVKWRTAQGKPPPSWKRLWDTLLRGTAPFDGDAHPSGNGAPRGVFRIRYANTEIRHATRVQVKQ